MKPVGQVLPLLASNPILFAIPLWIVIAYFVGLVIQIHPTTTVILVLALEAVGSAALLFALAQIKSGSRVKTQEALAYGFTNWGTLVVAQTVASLFVCLGLLFFVLPGLHLWTRWALVKPVVYTRV